MRGISTGGRSAGKEPDLLRLKMTERSSDELEFMFQVAIHENYTVNGERSDSKC